MKEYYTVSESTRKFRVPVQEIIRIEANRGYSVIHTSSGQKHVVSKNIGAINKSLQERNSFFRIHKSHLINTRHIKEYQSRDGGICLMSCGTALPIARPKKPGFLHMMK